MTATTRVARPLPLAGGGRAPASASDRSGRPRSRPRRCPHPHRAATPIERDGFLGLRRVLSGRGGRAPTSDELDPPRRDAASCAPTSADHRARARRDPLHLRHPPHQRGLRRARPRPADCRRWPGRSSAATSTSTSPASTSSRLLRQGVLLALGLRDLARRGRHARACGAVSCSIALTDELRATTAPLMSCPARTALPGLRRRDARGPLQGVAASSRSTACPTPTGSPRWSSGRRHPRAHGPGRLGDHLRLQHACTAPAPTSRRSPGRNVFVVYNSVENALAEPLQRPEAPAGVHRQPDRRRPSRRPSEAGPGRPQ